MKRRMIFLALVLLSCFPLMAASVWEGSAAMSSFGEFPSGGYYAASISFPRNTIVDVKNLENGKTVQVIITKGTDAPGILLMLSPDAAQALGVVQNAIARVRVSIPRKANEVSALPDSSGTSESGKAADPDTNPALLAGNEAGTAQPEADGMPAVSEVPAAPAVSAAPAAAPLPAPAAPEPAAAAAAPAPAPESAAQVVPASQPVAEAAPEPAAPEPAAQVVPAASVEPAAPAVAEASPAAETPAEAPAGTEVALAPTETPSPPEAPAASPAEAAPAEPTPGSSVVTLEPAAANPPPAEAPAAAPAEAPLSVESTPAPLETPAGSAAEPVLPEVAEEGTAPAEAAVAPAAAPAPAPAEAAPAAAPEETAVAPANAAPAVATAPAPEKAAVTFKAPTITALEKGKDYLQIGTFSKSESVTRLIDSIKPAYPIAVQSVVVGTGTVYRVLIGPLSADEAGVILVGFRAAGFPDAFVRTGK